MEMTFETDGNIISFSCDNTNEYEPCNDKERKITLHALTKEQKRTAGMLMRDINADHIELLDKELRILSELIEIYEHGNVFAVTPEYKRLLLAALSREKKHRQAARRIAAKIQSVPLFCKIDITGFIPFNDII